MYCSANYHDFIILKNQDMSQQIDPTNWTDEVDFHWEHEVISPLPPDLSSTQALSYGYYCIMAEHNYLRLEKFTVRLSV